MRVSAGKLRGMTSLLLIFRWLHLVAAITAVGGTIFMRFALVPSVGVLSDEQRAALHTQIRSRWGKLVMASIGFLLISGLFNYTVFLLTTKTEPWDGWRQANNGLYQGVFGVKFMLAMAIFFIASALTGRARGAQVVSAECQVLVDGQRGVGADRRGAVGSTADDAYRADVDLP